jgi:hypothetical protein
LSQRLYTQRFSAHLIHASSLVAKGDYVQAGEKIWGAVSALVNSRFSTEVYSVKDKKQRFLALLNCYLHDNPLVWNTIYQLGFRRLDEIFHSVYGLHKFFYGGTNYPEPFLKQIIPFLIQLIQKL